MGAAEDSPAAITALLLLLSLASATRAQAPEETSARPATVAAIALSIKSRAIQDSRCYLMNGGAVESFFISEDTPVGSVIGTLSVNGDPSENDGNISLKVQEKNAAIGIAPGTKNLTLLRVLDREEKLGPSNVYVNVRCDRRRTTDPSFVIPVSVRVWDVNDNAPEWTGAPYRVRLSELTAVGARVLPAARATDADQPGPHATIHYSVLPGPNSEYFGFVNELDSMLMVKKPLDYETLDKFTVTLRAQDQGNPPLHNDTSLHVEVLDADDQNPKFSSDHYTALLPDEAEDGTILETSPGPISAKDQDVGINAPLYYSASGARRDLVQVDRDTGRVAATAALLAEDTPVTLVLKATQVDNADRYALATLTVSRRSGALRAKQGEAQGSGVRFSRRHFGALVPEDAPPGAVLATLTTLSSQTDQNPLQFYVSDRSFLDKFAINSAGEVLLRRSLDYETAHSYVYQVMVTDGRANDTASINISVVDVNEWEPRFKYPQYEFRVSKEGTDDLFVGKLDVFDGDVGDRVTITLSGSDASMFYIKEGGALYLRRASLAAANASTLHVVATARDSGTPPRHSSAPVAVRVAGTTSSGVGVLAPFAAALAALALLVLALLAYIYRVKQRRRKSSAAAGTTPTKGGFVAHERPRLPAGSLTGTGSSGANGASVAIGTNAGALGVAPSGSLQSVSAGASTILANSSSSLDLRADTLPHSGSRSATTGRQSQRHPTKSRVAPAPPSVASGGDALMSDHVGGRAASRSGVAWPSATIPARVKKLSWDDGRLDQDQERKGSEGDQPSTLGDHMNLTVYF